MKIIGVIFFGFLTLFFFALFVNLTYVSFGFSKSRVKKANAYLRSYKFSKSINTKRGFIKYWTEGKYAYRVNGKYYFIDHGVACEPDKMPDAIKVTYQVRRPNLAYIHFPAEIVGAVGVGLFIVLPLVFAFVGIFMIVF